MYSFVHLYLMAGLGCGRREDSGSQRALTFITVSCAPDTGNSLLCKAHKNTRKMQELFIGVARRYHFLLAQFRTVLGCVAQALCVSEPHAHQKSLESDHRKSKPRDYTEHAPGTYLQQCFLKGANSDGLDGSMIPRQHTMNTVEPCIEEASGILGGSEVPFSIEPP